VYAVGGKKRDRQTYSHSVCALLCSYRRECCIGVIRETERPIVMDTERPIVIETERPIVMYGVIRETERPIVIETERPIVM